MPEYPHKMHGRCNGPAFGCATMPLTGKLGVCSTCVALVVVIGTLSVVLHSAVRARTRLLQHVAVC